ncbi:MAG: hypothetical protein F7C32_00455 [Desulfurococcales archaeon]|nr:hypothetical protein [Desulfurococcales archaeon]
MSATDVEAVEEQPVEEPEELIGEPGEAEEVETIQLDASLVEKMMEYVDVLLGVRDGTISLTEARALLKSIYPSFGVKKKKTKVTKKKTKKTVVKKTKKTSEKKAKKEKKKTKKKKSKSKSAEKESLEE